jgi:hypothetical protein
MGADTNHHADEDADAVEQDMRLLHDAPFDIAVSMMW